MFAVMAVVTAAGYAEVAPVVVPVATPPVADATMAEFAEKVANAA